MSGFLSGFSGLPERSGLRGTALLAAYRRGLDPLTRRQMAIYDDTVGLENFLQRALHISQHLTACHTEESFTTVASPATRPPAPEPIQTERYHLTPTERARRSNLSLCLYCGAHDHLLPDCPIRPTRPAVSTVQILPDVSKLPHIDALLIHMNQSPKSSLTPALPGILSPLSFSPKLTFLVIEMPPIIK